MRSLLMQLISIVVALGLGVMILGFAVVSSDISPPVRIINPAADPGWVPVVAWASAAFTEHGFELPPVDIYLQADLQSCRGNAGVCSSTLPSHITICAPHKPSDEMITSNRLLVVHELGHAWIAANVNHRSRDAFMQVRQLDNWNDNQQPWGTRGTEQGAEVIAAALLYGEHARGAQVCGFELLTNIPTPLGVIEDCTRLIAEDQVVVNEPVDSQ